MENSPKNALQLLITFCGFSIQAYLARNWQDGTILLGFDGTLGSYSNFMPVYWYDGAYRDLMLGSSVSIIRLLHLAPDPELNGVRVSVHRQVSPERNPLSKEDTKYL